MEKVLSWIVENYELLILVGACLLDVVLFLVGVFRKKYDPDKNSIVAKLPDLISLAEVQFGAGHGELKKQMVLDLAVKTYKMWTGVELQPGSNVYGYFEHMIEEILRTPQKKGK